MKNFAAFCLILGALHANAKSTDDYDYDAKAKKLLSEMRAQLLAENPKYAGLLNDLVQSRGLNTNSLDYNHRQALTNFLELPEVQRYIKAAKRVLAGEYNEMQRKVAETREGNFARDREVFKSIQMSFADFLKRGAKRFEKPYTEEEARRIVASEYELSHGMSLEDVIQFDPNMANVINRRILRYTLQDNPLNYKRPTPRQIEKWRDAEVSQLEKRFLNMTKQGLEILAERQNPEMTLVPAQKNRYRDSNDLEEGQGAKIKVKLRELLANPGWSQDGHFQIWRNGGYLDETHVTIVFRSPDGNQYLLKQGFTDYEGNTRLFDPPLWHSVTEIGVSRLKPAQFVEAQHLQIFSELNQIIDARHYLLNPWRTEFDPNAPTGVTQGKMLREFRDHADQIEQVKRKIWFRRRYGISDPQNSSRYDAVNQTQSAYHTPALFQLFMWGRTKGDPNFWGRAVAKVKRATDGRFFSQEKREVDSNKESGGGISRDPTPEEQARAAHENVLGDHESFSNDFHNHTDALDEHLGQDGKPLNAAFHVEGENIPDFFNVRFREDFKNTPHWEAPAVPHADLVVKTLLPIPADIIHKGYPVPIPDGHALQSFACRTATGRLLVAGRDYTVQELTDGRSGALVTVNSDVRAKGFRIEFGLKRDVATDLPFGELRHLDPPRLLALLPKLREAGFIRLADALDSFVAFHVEHNVTFGLRDVEPMFQRFSRYSTNGKTGGRISAADRARNPFLKYANFISDDALFCTQCHAANAMAEDFFHVYFDGTPAPNVRAKAMAVHKDGVLVLKPGHAQLEFYDDHTAFTADFTPAELDPTNVKDGHRNYNDSLQVKSDKLLEKNPTQKLKEYIERLDVSHEALWKTLRENPEYSGTSFIRENHPARWANRMVAAMKLLVENPAEFSEKLDELKDFFPGGAPETVSEFLDLLPAVAEQQIERLQFSAKKSSDPHYKPRLKLYADVPTIDRTATLVMQLNPEAEGISYDTFLWHWKVLKAPEPKARPSCPSRFSNFIF